MAHHKILSADLIPTFWRAGDKIIVGLWSRWPHGTPREDQLLSRDEVLSRVRSPGTPWLKRSPDNRFARGEHLLEGATGSAYLDMGSVTIDFPRGLRSRENWSVTMLHTGYLSQAVERFAETFNTKMSRRHIGAVQGRQQLLMVTSKFGSKDLDDDVYMLFTVNPELGCVTNMDLGPFLPEDQFDESSRTLLPTMALAGPSEMAANGVATFGVDIVDPATGAPYPHVPKPIEVHIESTAGYLPKRRVQTVDGSAFFKLHAIGLEPGDSIKIKVGWHNFTGAAEKIIKVV